MTDPTEQPPIPVSVVKTETGGALIQSVAPSNSTVASATLGLPLTILIAWIGKQFFGIEMPAEVSAALGGIITILSGLLFKGGLRAHTD